MVARLSVSRAGSFCRHDGVCAEYAPHENWPRRHAYGDAPSERDRQWPCQLGGSRFRKDQPSGLLRRLRYSRIGRQVREIKEQLNIIAEGAARLGKTLKHLRIIWWPTASIDEDWGKVREHLTARMASTLRHAYYDYKRGVIKEDEMPVPVEFARRIAE